MICSGFDIDKPRVWVHIKNAQGNTIFETNVGRDPKGLAKLQRYMKKYGVTRIVMESTSQYWIPVYKGLQRFVDEICVVNAYQLKVLGKHKTDKRDAELLATWGLLNVLKASYVPDMVIHELRQLVRARVDALNHRTAAINQLKTHLEGVCPGITKLVEQAKERTRSQRKQDEKTRENKRKRIHNRLDNGKSKKEQEVKKEESDKRKKEFDLPEVDPYPSQRKRSS